MISLDPAMAEQGAWRDVPQGWRQLYGDFEKLGVSVEWHDFKTRRSLDWGRSFHQQSIEFCLNLNGRGAVRAAGAHAEFVSGTSGYYAITDDPLSAIREANDRHQFAAKSDGRNFDDGRS